MKAIAILQEGLALLGPNGEHWTHGANARDIRDVPTFYNLEDAVKFCSSGIVYRVAGRNNDIERTIAMSYLNAAAGRNYSVFGFNDNNDWPTVKDMWLRAIAMAQSPNCVVPPHRKSVLDLSKITLSMPPLSIVKEPKAEQQKEEEGELVYA
jgi:hypothetical protein